MPRTAALGALTAVLLVWSWFRLERATPHGEVLAWAFLLGVLPALAPTRGRRLVAVALAAPLTAWAALGTAWPGEAADRFGAGFTRYFDVPLPFNAEHYPAMHGIVLLAIFGFALAVSLAVAERRPLLAAGLLVAGAAWPATLRPDDNELARGTVILAVALAVVASFAATPRLRQAVAAGAAVIVAALAVAGVPGVAKGEFLDWQDWDPFAESELPVDVRYVWATSYEPLEWPQKRTVVLRVQAPPTPRYWRATTLDVFTQDVWIPSEHSVSLEPVVDPLLPDAANDRSNLFSARVRTEALQDVHLIGATVPVDFEVDFGAVAYQETGTAKVPEGIPRGATYTAWSYSPRPLPRRLVASRPIYNVLHEPYLVVQSRTETPSSPPFGRAGREAEMNVIFQENFALKPYRPLYEQALGVVGDTASPYVAAVRLESWFRSGGGFEYDESPPAWGETPPLVHFVAGPRRGYCQQFAGAMALMLRYLGIPSRIGAGFTSGRYDAKEREWVVTDHNAHTWVEVWFRGIGWLPFDPTPGRGSLPGAYSASSLAFNLGLIAGVLPDAADNKLVLETRDRSRIGEGGRDIPGDPGAASDRDASLLRLLALVAIALGTAILLLKTLLRRFRLLTRDPRRLAAACRRDLHGFLADQRIIVPASATASELAELVRHELGLNLDAFAAAVDEARFSPPRSARRASRAARRELDVIRRQLRDRLGTWERARGAFSLRSLTA